MELTEPSMEYSNDVQFVRALHKCIDYINFTLPHSKRVPFEMIIGQAALESGWGSSRFAKEVVGAADANGDGFLTKEEVSDRTLQMQQ